MARRSAAFYITSIAVGGESSACGTKVALRRIFLIRLFRPSAHSPGLGNLLGYGISMMHGLRGMSGVSTIGWSRWRGLFFCCRSIKLTTKWRWVFVIEGLLTVCIALMGYLVLVDFPDRSTFLTPEQKAMVVERIHRDRGDSVADPMTTKKFLAYLCEPKIWLFAVWFCVTTLGTYSMSFFLPRILKVCLTERDESEETRTKKGGGRMDVCGKNPASWRKLRKRNLIFAPLPPRRDQIFAFSRSRGADKSF